MTARRFELHRDTDISGVSGTGVVAEGVEFDGATVVIHWLGEWPSTVVHHRGMPAVEHIHGHGGATRIVWVDYPVRPMTGSRTVARPFVPEQDTELRDSLGDDRVPAAIHGEFPDGKRDDPGHRLPHHPGGPVNERWSWPRAAFWIVVVICFTAAYIWTH